MITVKLLEKWMQEKIHCSAILQKKKIGVGQTLSFIKICTHTIYLIDTEKKKEKNSKENYEKTEKQNKKQIHEKHTMLVVIKKAIYFTAV